ncbi:DUF5908 family protein [Puia sp.]|jgi:hypothetical protein|uniref:DUF5908 family protein n=1 Tax=Puia sp. TaxID=2045100 RepID=UPI002F402913
MPIEVRELVIKATVEQENGSPNKPAPPPDHNNAIGPNEGLIQACIDKLTEILKTRYER